MNAATEATGEVTKLSVLYDERCAFCLRCRDWLLTQPCLVDVELLPAGSPSVRKRFGEIPGMGKELVVADDRGRVWVGPSAFVMCLWATARYRSWAYRLSRPRWAPFAERFFIWVSRRRDRWSAWLRRHDPDCTWCDQLSLEWDAR